MHFLNKCAFTTNSKSKELREKNTQTLFENTKYVPPANDQSEPQMKKLKINLNVIIDCFIAVSSNCGNACLNKHNNSNQNYHSWNVGPQQRNNFLFF